jgi:hypothetical protein
MTDELLYDGDVHSGIEEVRHARAAQIMGRERSWDMRNVSPLDAER